MVELLSAVSRLFALGGAAWLVGSAVFRYICIAQSQWREPAPWGLLLGAAFAVVLGHAGLLAAQLLALAELGAGGAYDFLIGTRVGMVWSLRAVLGGLLLAAAAGLSAARKPEGGYLACAALAAGYIALAPWGGHAAGAGAPWEVLAPNVVHMLAVAAWFGALPSWLLTTRAYARQPDRALPTEALARTLTRFSRLAMGLMLVIVLSGIWLATRYIENSGDLLGTRYGYLVLGKLGLLTVALAFANRLRSRFLPALRDAGDNHCKRRRAGEAARQVAVELAAAVGVLSCAAWLAQTTPALHEPDPYWWLPFRWSLEATWAEPGLRSWIVGGLLVAAVGAAAVLQGRRLGWTRLGAAGLLAGAGTLGWALAVPAYPTTYKRSQVPYLTVSVASGRALYGEHCAACHGAGGRGDGPAGASLARPPADLSEPHTALHTAGDMYWWLTHGIPESGMPPFGDRLSDDERWDLINFLRAFSEGFQSRVLAPQTVPGQAWLGAINFYLDGVPGKAELKAYRETHNVLLVFLGGPQAQERARALAAASAALNSRRTQVLAVPLGGTELPADLPFPVLGPGAAELWSAYDLLTRTVSNRGAPDRLGMDWSHAEFLVDRFGYVRARWIADEGPDPGWAQPERLYTELERLNAEPRLRPPPDDHVH
ncbi:CopD family protein [Sinimarinibacterium flocculans]|uniref:CopD family protein n=1 Tax=Sinimarinibacterium flocculans TaxID=985250 RepID=UPI003517C3BA